MRVQETSDGLTVHAVGGSHVVLLGWDFPKSACSGLAGFGLHRTDHLEQEAFWLRSIKTFEATDPGLPRGSLHSTRQPSHTKLHVVRLQCQARADHTRTGWSR